MATSPERPSTWRLLFGGNKKHRGTEPHDGDNNGSLDHEESEASGPEGDVAARLLQALSAREKKASPEDAIGRECCEELLGGHNAFAPELPRRGLADVLKDASGEQQRARDIISTRMAVDERADAIRKAKAHGQRQRDKAKVRPVSRPRADPASAAAERLQKLREIQRRRDEEEKTRRGELKARQEQKARSARPRQPPSGESSRREGRSNQEDATLARQHQALDDKLRRLKVENQRAAELEERLVASKQLLRVKRRVWAIWSERVERRRRQEASVARGYEWRRLQQLWAAWRRVASVAKRERVAAQTQARLVGEKLLVERADKFHCAKRLLLWFHRWRAATNAAREAKQIDREAQQRRERAQRLLERVAKAQESSPHQGDEQCESSATQSPAHAVASAPRERPRARRKETWVATAAPARADTKAKAASSPDSFYSAMQERAQRRKAQREQLRLRYEHQEREKREALAKQIAEREALLEKQKHDERERLREQRRAQARLAREKAERRDVEAIQLQSARLHDRLRLLFHYAWRPWQQRWLASRRVARGASQWHALRLAHRSWTAWQSFVERRRAQRRRIEQERLQLADRHHQQTLLRSAVAAWRLAMQATQTRSLAVQRQTKWIATRRAWTTWRRSLAMARDREQQREGRARARVERRRVGAVLAAWCETAAESKRARVRQAEKDLLWKKARMWLDD